MEFIIVLLIPILFMPMITGYMAYGNGRSFWRWFGLGFALPYFSLLLITYVVYRDQRKSRTAQPNSSNSNLP
jgi:hypothetical protein